MEASRSCATGLCVCMPCLYSGYAALRYSMYGYVRKCTCQRGGTVVGGGLEIRATGLGL